MFMILLFVDIRYMKLWRIKRRNLYGETRENMGRWMQQVEVGSDWRCRESKAKMPFVKVDPKFIPK